MRSELWLRGGFEWALNNDITIKNQVYNYNAQRHWIDSETYAFDLATSTIDRDRFFVSHNQHVIGDNTDLTWNSSLFGMENRFAAQLQVSRNDITFTEEGNPNAYPADTVSVLNPAPGLYGGRWNPIFETATSTLSRDRSKTVSSSRRCSR